MNVVTWWVGLLSTLAVVAGDVSAQDAAPPLAVRLRAPEAVFVGEAFEVVVELDYDAAWFAEHAVALLRRATSVPFHVDVPWLDGEAPRVALVTPTADAIAVPVGDRERSFARVSSEPRTVLRLQLRCVAPAAGPLALGGVAVRYAFATEFRDHLLRGREPVDRQEATVTAEPRVVAVRALPKPAPADFCGVVGDVQLSASASATEVAVGAPFELLLDVTSAGDLSVMPAPRPSQLEGFVVQGVVERPAASGQRRFALDLLPLREGVTAVPPVTTTVFSPQRGDYLTVASAPTPLRVLAAQDAAGLTPRVRELIVADRAARGLDAGVPWWVWLVGALGVAVAGWLASRGGAARRRRAALAQQAAKVRELAAGDAAALVGAFEALLSSVAGVSPFALPACVAALGGDLGAAVDALWHELDAARFGGPRPPAERIGVVVDRLLARG